MASGSSSPKKVPDQPDLLQRILVGPTLVVTGVTIYVGLFLLHLMKPKDVWHAVGILVGAEAYGTIGGLFVLIGLRYIFGPSSWIEEKIGKSIKWLMLTAIVMTILILLAVILIVW